MKQQNQNPYSNPIVQALLDVKKLLWDEDIQLDNIDDIIQEFSDNEQLRDRASKLWASHKIPEKSVKFMMSLVYNKCPERFALPRDEQLILGLMERIQNQSTGAVAIRKQDIVKLLRFTDTQRKHLQKSLNHLTETGFITCIYQPPQGDNRHPAVYTVNRAVSWIGVPTDNAPGVHVAEFTRLYKQVLEPVVLPDGTTIICGSLQEYAQDTQEDEPEQENRASIGENTDSAREISSVPVSQIDYNKSGIVIQEDYSPDELPGQMKFT